jgi:hypothetical protein
MKKKKDNPIVIGALAVLLLFCLGRIFRTLQGNAEPQVASEQATPDTTSTDRTVAIPTAYPTSRDPFSHPWLLIASKTGVGNAKPAASDLLPLGTSRELPLIGAPASQAAPSGQVTAPTASSREGAKSFINPIPDTDTKPASEPELPDWRLSAVILGQTHSAILEGVGPVPVRVCVGDTIENFQVVSISADQIVLRQKQNVWTLKVQEGTPRAEENVLPAMPSHLEPKPALTEEKKHDSKP